jgi:hypothetical protein
MPRGVGGYYATSQKVTSSSTDEVVEFLQFAYSFRPHYSPEVDAASITEMSTRNIQIMFLGSTARPVRKTNILTAICEQIV